MYTYTHAARARAHTHTTHTYIHTYIHTCYRKHTHAKSDEGRGLGSWDKAQRWKCVVACNHYSLYDSKKGPSPYDSKKGPSPSNKMTPPTSNVNVNYHDQCTFKLVFTMLPYHNIQI